MDLNIIERLKKNYEEAEKQANKTGDINDILEVCSKLETLNKALGILKYDCENLAKRAKEKYQAKIEDEQKIKTKELFFENYTEAKLDALIEKKLKEAIERGFNERLKLTKTELLEQMIAIDEGGEESLVEWEKEKEKEEAEFDSEVVEYEKKLEKEEDERDNIERRKREKETKRKTELGRRNREENGEFYSFWGGRMEELRSLFPKCENSYVGKNRGRKFKRDFKKETLLFLRAVDNFISFYADSQKNKDNNIAFFQDLNTGKKYYFDENNNVRCLDDDWEARIEQYKKQKKEGDL